MNTFWGEMRPCLTFPGRTTISSSSSKVHFGGRLSASQQDLRISPV
uniref:Uncharacterized protein n=1 Tax=Anguilla anguilla TaxID=7936 RepID=A0A0E9SLZ1_ANGAN